MRGLISLVFIVLIYANGAFGQDKANSSGTPNSILTNKPGKTERNKKFSFGFNNGIGIPIGEFRKTDETKFPLSKFNGGDSNHLGGYAQSGFHYEFYAAYKIIPRLSILVSASGNDIGYDINTLDSQYILYVPPNSSIVTSGDSYYIIQYLIGPDFTIPLGKNFSIEIKALAGLTTTNYPALTYVGLTETEIFAFQGGNGFGYSAGTSLKFVTANGYIGVHLNINYVGSTINYSSYAEAFYTPSSPNPALSNNYLGSAIYNEQKSLMVSLIQVSLGVSVEL
jgi:hypothetical protein